MMNSRSIVQVGVVVAVLGGSLFASLTGFAGISNAAPAVASQAVAPQADDLEAEGFERILRQRRNGTFSKAGWNHYGPGHFELDAETGVLASQGGMGLLWYAAEEYGDFALDLEFMTEIENANSGVFVRVPGTPSSDDYIYHSWEVQIHDTSEGIHQTGAIYDAEAPTRLASKGAGEWNRMRITFVGDQITVDLNGERVVDWTAEPRGKVEDFAARGFVGLQNHDHETRSFFRNIFIKKLD